MSDLIGHVFKDVTPEVLERERQRMIEEGEIIVHETPFGTLEIKKCKWMEEGEVFMPKNYAKPNK